MHLKTDIVPYWSESKHKDASVRVREARTYPEKMAVLVAFLRQDERGLISACRKFAHRKECREVGAVRRFLGQYPGLKLEYVERELT